VAALQLRRVGLDAGTVAHLPDNAVPEGTVIAQDPPAHSHGIERPSVNLLVAAPDDEAPDGYVMPQLVGLPIVTAQDQLARFGIKTNTPVFVDVPIPAVGAGNTPPALPIAVGSVTAQSPPAGARVDQATLVNLTVAK
jgi:beta-lactam-binding protein with PASTA domain